jgi:hypothetical protein
MYQACSARSIMHADTGNPAEFTYPEAVGTSTRTGRPCCPADGLFFSFFFVLF